MSSFPLPQRGILGKNAQTRVQDKKYRKFGIFHREYSIGRALQWNGYDFMIQGRIDGVYELKDRVEIEEIKSVILTTREFKNLHIEKYPEFSAGSRRNGIYYQERQHHIRSYGRMPG